MKKRILIYGMNYAPEIAGVGRYTGEIGAYLAAQGHEVNVVTTVPHYPGWAVFDGHAGRRWTRETRDGVTVWRCPLYLHREMRGLRRLLAPLTFALSSAPVALWRILASRPDVVLAVEPTLLCAPLALAAARLVGARTVLHVQDLEVEAAFAVGHIRTNGFAKRLAGLFDRGATRAFDRVITISSKMAEKIRAKGVRDDRVHVIRNWVDLDQIRPDLDGAAYRRELGLREDAFVVLYSGNLGAKQGVGLLLETARRLASEPKVQFVIAGAGPLRDQAAAAAEALPNLVLLDFQPEARLGEFLRSADLHVLPQEREAADLLLPSKLGGMLASGRPIVVTADPGTELADFLGESCRLTPPGDAESLAQAILQSSREPPGRDKEAQRLARADMLGKQAGIAAFARAALFLHEDAPGAAQRRKAA